MKTFRFLALLFALFLIMIVLAVNLGVGNRIFARLYAIPYADKTGHFMLYGILSLLISLGFRPARLRLLGIPLLRTSLILAVVAILEELSQQIFPSRSPDMFDLLAGLAGIFLFGELGVRARQLFPGLFGGPPGQPENRP